jgi:predicted nucleotidyltransferase
MNINEVSPKDISITSFNVKDELCPIIWENQKLDNTIRLHLLKIAKDFYSNLAINWVKVHDVILTGSLANYNWSTYSDFDVHILINYDNVDDDYDMVVEYLKSLKTVWNNEHDITIKGFDVELYIQDTKEEHNSTGIYSLIKDTWIIKPEKLNESFNKNIVKNKIALILNKVDYYQKLIDDGNYVEAGEKAMNLWEKIKRMRITSLAKKGEMSNGNIIFKGLRRLGYIEKLNDIIIDAYDKSATIT